MQADEQVDALCMLLLCDAQDGRSTIMDGNDNSIQQIAAMMLLQMRADGDSGGNHWQPLATTGNPGKGGNPGKHVNWEIGLEEFPKKRTDTTNRTNSTNSAIRDKVIVVTVPHSACVSGKGAMGSEIGLNSNDMKQLELLQWRLDSALFAASPLNERACDRRAVVGAIALKMAFMRFLEETSPLIDDAGMIVLVNDTQPRAECDTNRFSCGHSTGSDTSSFQQHVAEVTESLSTRGYRMAWNVDAHSFPLGHGVNPARDESVYMLARVHPEPFASQKWSLLKSGFNFNVYAGSEENYFMRWFEDTKRVPSLLVEFCEDPRAYPLTQLNHDAHLIVEFVLRNIDLYKTLM
jgi:hypothetical protein